MKWTQSAPVFLLCIIISTLSCTGNSESFQAKQDWEEEAKTNIRLLPKYGYREKTEEQKQADNEFIDMVLKDESYNNDPKEASERFILRGFDHLYDEDPKTAMYRFNQAYLLDSTNTNIYWGFGSVYFLLGDLENAKKQYELGLHIKPDNTNILTDLGSFYIFKSMENESGSPDINMIDSAIHYLAKSYQIDTKNQNTTFKLSLSYLLKEDCEKAWRFYDECKLMGGDPITEDYTEELLSICPK